MLSWPVCPLGGTIAEDEVHLWAWSLETAAPGRAPAIELLDAHERQKMQRFHFAPDRDRYAVAHANLRRILGAYSGQRPEQIRFRANRFGKPELVNESSSSLTFNLSHSQTVAVVALARDRALGVDVEDIHPIESEVAKMHFSPAELFQLRKLHDDAWLIAFYRCWTRKEALVKAEGVGLGLALDSFDVGLSAEAELLGTRQPFTHAWKLYDVSPSSRTIGALATAPPKARLSCYSL